MAVVGVLNFFRIHVNIDFLCFLHFSFKSVYYFEAKVVNRKQ